MSTDQNSNRQAMEVKSGGSRVVKPDDVPPDKVKKTSKESIEKAN